METNYSFDSSDSSISYINFPTSSSSTAYNSTPSSLSHRQPSPAFHRPLHSVRKPAHPNKPRNNSSINKKPAAPPPSNPTRVYMVDRMNFRELVQMLTGATAAVSAGTASQPGNLHEVAPLPPDLAPRAMTVFSEMAASTTTTTPPPELYREMVSAETLTDGFLGTSLGLGLSPSPVGWCSVPLLSPRTLSSFEPSTVL